MVVSLPHLNAERCITLFVRTSQIRLIEMAGVAGFEPTPVALDTTTQVLKTRVLPLHYTPIVDLLSRGLTDSNYNNHVYDQCH